MNLKHDKIMKDTNEQHSNSNPGNQELPIPAITTSIGSPANGMTASAVTEYLASLRAVSPKITSSLAACQKEFEELRAMKLHEGNFLGYLITFESHERLQPFIDIIPRLSDQEYWKILREVWTGAEVVLPDKQVWLRLLQWRRPGREHLMTGVERTALAAMPAEIKIWRGCGDRSAVRGLSWTLDRDRAVSFAERACGERIRHLTGLCGTTPLLVEATCYKSDVLAYITEREEAELVVRPRTVNVRKKSPIQSNKVSV